MKTASSPVTMTGNDHTTLGHKAQIDPEAFGIVMDILSKMYTNGYKAVLREYTVNGVDAHVEVGQTRPVEVSLPSELQPALTIRDFGPGLDEDGIILTFGTYGRSTKRDTNEQAGRFGIGSKSAYVMVNQFIVTGFRDGLRTVVEFTLDENNVSTAYVRRVTETDEPNGVLISMGVPDPDRMHAEAAEFFGTWNPGTVLVDGAEPAKVWDQGYALNDHIHVVPDSAAGVNVVMGQVAYPVNSALMTKVADALDGTTAHAQALTMVHWGEYSALYFTVPMGSVDIAPNREGLRDTDATARVLAGLVQEMVDEVGKSVQTAVDSAPSIYLAALALEEQLDGLSTFRLPRDAFPYKGKPITKAVNVEDVVRVFVSTRWGYRGKQRYVAHSTEPVVMKVAKARRTVVVVVDDEAGVDKVKRFAKRFLEEHEDYDELLVTTKAKGTYGWFQWGRGPKGVTTWTLDEYRQACRELRGSAPRTVNEPSYTVGWNSTASRELTMRDTLSDIISWGKDIVVFHDRSRVGAFGVSVLQEDFTPVVLLSTQSLNALRKRVDADGSISVYDGDIRELITKAAVAEFAQYSDAQREAVGARQWLNRNWSMISDFEGFLSALTLDGQEEVTHRSVLGDVDTIALARMIAEQITQDEYDEMKRLAEHIEGSSAAIPFDADVVGFTTDLFPLVAVLDKWTLKRNENIRSEALAYVNSKA